MEMTCMTYNKYVYKITRVVLCPVYVERTPTRTHTATPHAALLCSTTVPLPKLQRKVGGGATATRNRPPHTPSLSPPGQLARAHRACRCRARALYLLQRAECLYLYLLRGASRKQHAGCYCVCCVSLTLTLTPTAGLSTLTLPHLLST